MRRRSTLKLPAAQRHACSSHLSVGDAAGVVAVEAKGRNPCAIVRGDGAAAAPLHAGDPPAELRAGDTRRSLNLHLLTPRPPHLLHAASRTSATTTTDALPHPPHRAGDELHLLTNGVAEADAGIYRVAEAPPPALEALAGPPASPVPSAPPAALRAAPTTPATVAPASAAGGRKRTYDDV